MSFENEIVEQVSQWMEDAVLGLGLCPFAAEPWNSGRVRMTVSLAPSENSLLEELSAEIKTLSTADPATIETTLLIIPNLLVNFGDYNQFLDLADQLLQDNNREGEFQIASFHPNYQFAGTQPEDPSNFTNRAPYPLLHILRESSVTRALDNWPNPEQIPISNIETMRNLSAERRREIFGPSSE